MGNRRSATPRPTSAHLCLKSWLLGLTLALATPALLRAVEVDQLPSPRPAHWVLDTTGTLSATDVALIDARADRRAEIALSKGIDGTPRAIGDARGAG